MLKNALSFLAALAITTSAAGVLPSTDNTNIASVSAASSSSSSLPSKVDLSKAYDSVKGYIDETSPFFTEKIGNQGDTNSCVSFTSTYYQFTYEARKAYLDKFGVLPSISFSPEFIFNHVNQGANNGYNLEDAYRFIKQMGALTINDAEFRVPPFGKPEEFDYTHQENNPELLCKALKIRLNDYHPIVSNGYEDGIKKLKKQLANNKIIGTQAFFDYDYYVGTTQDGEYACVQNINKDDNYFWGHAFTIVGYDDNIKIKYRGQTFKGAFKIVNSWYNYDQNGTQWTDEWRNKGFMWVAYDALKPYSDKISCTREGYHRVPAFGYDSTLGYTMDVGVKDMKLIAEADVDSNNLGGITIQTVDVDNENNVSTYSGFSNNYTNTYSGAIVTDIDSMCKNDYFTNRKYRITLTNSNSSLVYVHSLSLRDDLGKVVAHVDIDGVKNSGVVELDLQRGDINYDHVLDSADRDMLLNYVNYVRYQKDKGAFEYSTLQKDLMDINADGKINEKDIEAFDNDCWTSDGKYISDDGSVWTGWHIIRGSYYYLDENGYRATNRFIRDENKNETLYVGADGRQYFNRKFTVNGITYFADELGYVK